MSTVFLQEYEIYNAMDLTYKSSYIDLSELIKLIKYRIQKNRITKINLITGGRKTIKIKTNKYKKYGINRSSNYTTKKRNKLQSHIKIKRKS